MTNFSSSLQSTVMLGRLALSVPWSVEKKYVARIVEERKAPSCFSVHHLYRSFNRRTRPAPALPWANSFCTEEPTSSLMATCGT